MGPIKAEGGPINHQIRRGGEFSRPFRWRFCTSGPILCTSFRWEVIRGTKYGRNAADLSKKCGENRIHDKFRIYFQSGPNELQVQVPSTGGIFGPICPYFAREEGILALIHPIFRPKEGILAFFRPPPTINRYFLSARPAER